MRLTIGSPNFKSGTTNLIHGKYHLYFTAAEWLSLTGEHYTKGWRGKIHMNGQQLVFTPYPIGSAEGNAMNTQATGNFVCALSGSNLEDLHVLAPVVNHSYDNLVGRIVGLTMVTDLPTEMWMKTPHQHQRTKKPAQLTLPHTTKTPNRVAAGVNRAIHPTMDGVRQTIESLSNTLRGMRGPKGGRLTVREVDGVLTLFEEVKAFRAV